MGTGFQACPQTNKKNRGLEFSVFQASQLLSGFGAIENISQGSPSSAEVPWWVHVERERRQAKGWGRGGVPGQGRAGRGDASTFLRRCPQGQLQKPPPCRESSRSVSVKEERQEG